MEKCCDEAGKIFGLCRSPVSFPSISSCRFLSVQFFSQVELSSFVRLCNTTAVQSIFKWRVAAELMEHSVSSFKSTKGIWPDVAETAEQNSSWGSAKTCDEQRQREEDRRIPSTETVLCSAGAPSLCLLAPRQTTNIPTDTGHLIQVLLGLPYPL